MKTVMPPVEMDGIQDRFCLVLVEPSESRNVGSVARAMRNLGFRHLRLVAPVGYDRERARITACWAESVLDELTIHDRLEDALADAEDVVGLSGKPGRVEAHPSHFVSLPEWAGALPGRPLPRTALVFGPEDNGLCREHLEQCRTVVRIPAAAECPSFNLAQAALLVMYEITRSLPVDETPTPPATDTATWNEHHHLDRLVNAVMEESGFVRPGSPAPVPGIVRNLFRRLPLSKHEMGVLLGLFGRVNTTLRYHREHKPEEPSDHAPG